MAVASALLMAAGCHTLWHAAKQIEADTAANKALSAQVASQAAEIADLRDELNEQKRLNHNFFKILDAK